MPADGHVAIIISHTGKNEQLAEIEKMLHRGGTKIIVISGNRKGVVGQYATEFYTRQVLKKWKNFGVPRFLHRGNIFLIFYMEWNLADGTKKILL